MKASFLSLLICLLAFTGRAQQNYDASLIPKELTSYATAVIRTSDESTEVKDLGTTVYRLKKVVTVLNKNGDDHAEIVVWYNKSNVIKSIRGAIYNSFGKQTGKFSDKDFEDVSAASNASLFEDSRIKRYQPAVIVYPYTVEYELEIRSKQSLNLSDWEPITGTGVAVEHSTYKFICKPDFTINYVDINTPEKAVAGTDAQGLKTYTWQIANLKALRPEPYSPDAERYLPLVKIAPQNFEYEGIPGSFTNWKELGAWVYNKLLLNRDGLPPETIAKVKELTAGIIDPKLKAKKLYEYMQQKTRYVSVQVGIGGYQPFLASDVDRTSYGDCKALVNYTHALLKAAGIESWYCVVKSGSRKRSFMPEFASMDQGDHVILAVPFKSDTTWLECTSQTIPFGFLGDFTDDRLVLACTPEGGKILHTPKYSAGLNMTHRTGDFTIDTNGDLSGNMITKFEGTDYDTRDYLINEAYTEQVKKIKQAYPISNLNIDKLSFQKADDKNLATVETIKLQARDFAPLNSGKYYFKVNLANRNHGIPDDVRNRRTDVYINRGYVEEDEISYLIPDGYKPEKDALNKQLDKPFGKYIITSRVEGKKLIFKRRLQMNDGTYPKDEYENLVDFLKTVSMYDDYTMVLTKG